MLHHFYHLRDPMDECLDDEGIALPSLAAARAHALTAAYSIMSADILEGKLDLNQRIDVEDDEGNIVHTVHFRDVVRITGQASS